MPTNTMKAIRLHEHGGPEVLRYEEVPVPEPKPGEVLVRVHAVGINPPDWYLRDGMTLGICAGQQSRIDCTRRAVHRSILVATAPLRRSRSCLPAPS